ncbi:hypothetical protein [Aeromicrobium sp.]|uniref:hypothetical protein n=1 Tax=Aeromicrobium sp. TaxID=1871063 RepID=UPI0030BFFF96
MTALFEPMQADDAYSAVGDWRPTRYTDTLTGDESFTTDGNRLLEAVATFWTTTEGTLDLDEWQVWVVRRVLETYPPWWPVVELRGQLRYKKVLISLARQNGKSVIGAVLAFYFLTMHKRGPKVGGFASIDSQARIVYDRVRFAIDKHPVLKARFNPTVTRGISYRDGRGIYRTHPAKVESLQGEPFTAALYDELHLGDLGLWNAITIGQRSKRGAMLVGLTTAGDDESKLLLTLYDEAATAIDASDVVRSAAAQVVAEAEGVVSSAYAVLAQESERFGAFIWEATELDDEGVPLLNEANVISANPAVACGRIPLRSVMSESRTMWRDSTGRLDVIRYTLNVFLQGTADAWLPAATFNRLGIDPDQLDRAGEVVWGLERTDDWEHATITATYHPDDRFSTELVATINGATEDMLYRACSDLAALGPCAFAMPADTLKPLGKRLRDDGHEVWTLAINEMQHAYATVRGTAKAGSLQHANDSLVRLQSSRAKPRKTEDGSRLSRTLSVGHIDALLATFSGVFVASTRGSEKRQFF